ncbi:MAG: relaxase/mobilization nuclease domain-containing protein [Azoarcus sp.]|nr:relaxase/mobilization nuclease domain-containing protein [Azoarcus sp.]
MIAKQIIGGGFRGALDYLRHGTKGSAPERGEVLDTNLPVSDFSPRAFAAGFGAFRKLNPKLGRPVYHVSLSPAPGDEISDDQWRQIARHYLDGMGFADCAFVLIKHDEEAEGEAVRPPHIHILACRIRPDSTTVSDKNNFRRSETVVRDIEARFGLIGVASPKPKKTRRTEMTQNKNSLAQADHEPEISISIGDELDANERRELRRQLLDEEYLNLLRIHFSESVLYVRKGSKGITLHFKDGGRVQDFGDRVSAYAMPSASAAAALIDLAIMKGWPSVVLTGNEAFLKEAFSIALARGLMVQPRPDQIEVFAAVQREYQERKRGKTGASIAPPIALPPPKSLWLDSLSGPQGLRKRLQDRPKDDDESGAAPNRPRGPSM